MRVEVVMTVLSIGLNFLLRPWLGLSGLVLSTVLAMLFTIIGFLLIIKKEIVVLGMGTIAGIVLKTSCASLLMGLVCYLARQAMIAGGASDIILILSISMLGLIFYMVCARLFGIDDATSIVTNGSIMAKRAFPWLPIRPIDPATHGGDLS